MKGKVVMLGGNSRVITRQRLQRGVKEIKDVKKRWRIF